MKSVAVFKTKFLPYSETFIHDEIRHHVRYRPFILTDVRQNSSKFFGYPVTTLKKEDHKGFVLEQWIFKELNRSWTFEQAIKKNKIDLIHAHFATCGTRIMHIAKRMSIPLVVTLHGNDVSVKLAHASEKKLRIYKRLFDQASVFLAVSQDLKNIAIKAGCDPEKIRLWKIGTDLQTFDFSPRPIPKTCKIVMVGRFVDKKGFCYGIEALSRVIRHNTNVSMHIIGDGPLKEQLIKHSVECGVEKHINFLGILPHSSIVNHLKDASLVLVPSIVGSNGDKEGLPTVIKEAFACGVPVIGSIHGGIPSIIQDGKNGYLVPERDVSLIAQRIAEILNDPNLWVQMSSAARKLMEEEYDIVKCNERLESIYDEVLQTKPSPP